jgi:hypothetical protein
MEIVAIALYTKQVEALALLGSSYSSVSTSITEGIYVELKIIAHLSSNK